MNHDDFVKLSFKKQAEKFATYHMSKVEYTDYLIREIGAKGDEHVLETAAGTCICGRALAPFVKDITCLDLTEEMLAQGKKLAAETQIKNISFETGNAEDLPYKAETFDLVITRLSFHHFINPEKPFQEMQRLWNPYARLTIKLKKCVIRHTQGFSAGKNLKGFFRKIFHYSVRNPRWSLLLLKSGGN